MACTQTKGNQLAGWTWRGESARPHGPLDGSARCPCGLSTMSQHKPDHVLVVSVTIPITFVESGRSDQTTLSTQQTLVPAVEQVCREGARGDMYMRCSRLLRAPPAACRQRTCRFSLCCVQVAQCAQQVHRRQGDRFETVLEYSFLLSVAAGQR